MIIVDVETTGLRPVEKYSIVSIGALEFDNPTNQFYQECRMREGAEIDPSALQVNGFTEEQIKNPTKQSLEYVMREFLEWSRLVQYRVLAGDNISFDRDYLQDSAQRYGVDWDIQFRPLDLYTLFYAHNLQRGISPPVLPNGKHMSTDRILGYVGLPPEPKPHRALMGAKVEAEAFSRLIYRRSLLEEFKKYALPSYLLR